MADITSMAAFTRDVNTDQYLPLNIQKIKRSEIILRITITAIIVPLGTIGNILSFVVLRQKQLRVSTVSFFLSVLAIVDTAVLYFACLVANIGYASGRSLTDKNDFWCRFNWFTNVYTIQLSAWMLILVSVERAAAVWFPLRARRLYGRNYPTYMVLFVFLLLFVNNLPHLFTREVIEGVCKAKEHFRNFDGFNRHLISFVNAFFPSAVILLSNILVAIKVNGFKRIKRTKATSNTVMMVATTLTFVALTFPSALYGYFHSDWYYLPTEERVYIERDFAIWHMLSFTNSAINFLLYVCTGPRFRREVVRLLLKRDRVIHPEASDLNVSQTMEITSARNSHVTTLSGSS